MPKSKRLKTLNKNNGQGQRKDGLEKDTPTNNGATADNCGFTSDILPPELWELIFKKVESPKDLLSCWNTYSGWRSALQSTDYYFKMTLPFLLPYLSFDDMLQCSAVSKLWNATVDACIQEAEDIDSNHSLNEKQKYARTRYLYSASNMNKFINGLSLSSTNESGKTMLKTNPLPFRRVQIELTVRSNLEWNNVVKCFDHFGHLIHHLHLKIYKTEHLNSCLKRIKLIESCLQRAPNLRVLHIGVTKHGSPVETDNTMEEFKTYNLENPWPSLEHLKVLKFGVCTDREEYVSIANAYAPQLVQLQFSYIFMTHLRSLAQFPCLQKIGYMSAGYVKGCENEMNFADFMQTSLCALKHLKVEFWHDPTDKHCDDLTMVVNAASATLETLILSRGHDASMKNVRFNINKFEEMRLPKLKVLELTTFDYPRLKFLQNVCPALEQLTFAPLYSENMKMLENEQLYCDLYRKHEFWNQLANITSVDLKRVFFYGELNFIEPESRHEMMYVVLCSNEPGKVYTRRGYEAKAKEKQDRHIGTDNQSSILKTGEAGCSQSQANLPQNGVNPTSGLMTRSKKVYQRN